MKKIVTVGTNAFAVVLLARRVFCVFGLVAVVLGTVGCSTTTPMALSRNSQSINTPMGLLVIETTSNLQGPINGHLKPYVLDFSATQDGKPFRYSIERDLYPSYANLIVTNDTLVHLVSIPLVSSSSWTLNNMHGRGLQYEQLAKRFHQNNLYTGNFNWKFDKQTGPLPSRGVLYLGHVKMKQRLRTSAAETSLGAGTPGMILVVEQKLSKANETTFDVEILDCQDADLRLFRQQCPILNNVQVEKALLH